MSQTAIMLESEGDAWLERNRARLGKHDPVSEVIETLNIHPQHVLEVGASNGWRLRKLRERYGCSAVGVDPSEKASSEALDNGVVVYRATADRIPLPGDAFDVVIFGFALYLAAPADWLRIAAEADRLLQDGGALIIHDFPPPLIPFAVPYKHHAGVLSYHFDFAKLWLAHPRYALKSRTVFGDDAVTVLTKGAREIEVRR